MFEKREKDVAVTTPEKINVEEIFAQDVFTMEKMLRRLSEETAAALQTVYQDGGRLTELQADEIAQAMKEWAVENGATHYTHWFQPLNGTTAEKHDALSTLPVRRDTR